MLALSNPRSVPSSLILICKYLSAIATLRLTNRASAEADSSNNFQCMIKPWRFSPSSSVLPNSTSAPALCRTTTRMADSYRLRIHGLLFDDALAGLLAGRWQLFEHVVQAPE